VCWPVENQLAILELLLKSGADPNLADTDGITVLHSSMAMQ
jgi:ankyrin repeat protein